jgi:hypothetical protein
MVLLVTIAMFNKFDGNTTPFMKHLLVFIFLCFAIVAVGQQNPYFSIFEPNRDGSGEGVKKSAQKTVVVMSCDMETTSSIDSANCLENVTKFDEKGRVIEQHELYTGLLRKYTYDNKDRVTGYTETQTATNTQLLNLTIEYDKKGRITQLVNKATQGAKSVVYYAKDERLLISETMGAIDEVTFKNGRMVKYVNRNSAEILLYLVEYEYDKNGRLIKETGLDIIEGAGSKFAVTTTYNAQGKKVTETAEFWEEATPANKRVQKTGYFYNDAGQLYQKERSTPEGNNYMTVYQYNQENQLITADYFDGPTRLVTLYYYYR